MLTLEDYLASAPDAAGIIAAALTADMNDHAMAASCVMLAELADQQDASGHVVEGAVLRRASRWLQVETQAHRKVADELGSRAAGDTFSAMRRKRRARMTETRDAMRPLFDLAHRFLLLALSQAAMDEATALLDTGAPEAVALADHILGFARSNRGGASDAG